MPEQGQARDEHVDRPPARRHRRDQPPPEASRWRHDNAGPRHQPKKVGTRGRSRCGDAFAGHYGRVAVTAVAACSDFDGAGHRRTASSARYAPSGDVVGVVLVDGAALAREAPAPHGGVDLGDGGPAGRNIPPVERPEMNARPQPLPDEPQPRNSGARRLRHRPLHVEMKNRLCAAGALLGQSTPSRVACARFAVAPDTIAHEIDVGVVFIRRPMALEIV